jgi:hypothetical protein
MPHSATRKAILRMVPSPFAKSPSWRIGLGTKSGQTPALHCGLPDWSDKAAALASRAQQADDDALQKLAMRIQSRAVRRCGELLKTFDAQGKRTDKLSNGDDTKWSQREAAERAGISKRQQVTAVRVANVPAQLFKESVESKTRRAHRRIPELGTGES